MKISFDFISNERTRKVIKITGNLLSIASIVFIVIYFVQAKVDFTFILQPGILPTALLAGFIVSFSVYANALAWKKNLEMFSPQKAHSADILYIYTRANLAKYIPGNVMHFVSRNVLGSELGLSHKQMGLSSVIEVIFQIIVIIIFILILVADSLFHSIRLAVSSGQMSFGMIIAMVAVITAIIAAALVYLIKKHKSMHLRPKNLLFSSAYYVLFCIINSAAFALVILLTRDGTNGYSLITLSGYYMLAWFLGFITPGAPSGLGVREYIMIVLFTPVYPQPQILALIIVMRIVTVLGDILAFLMVAAAKKIQKRKQNASIKIGGA